MRQYGSSSLVLLAPFQKIFSSKEKNGRRPGDFGIENKSWRHVNLRPLVAQMQKRIDGTDGLTES